MMEFERKYFENLPELLEASANQFGEKEALTIANGISYTYGEIHDLSLQIASMLFGMGTEKGDKVALISENNPHWVAAYFGIMKAGGIVAPVLTDFSGGEMASIIEHSESKILFVSHKQLKKFTSKMLQSLEYIVTIEDLGIYEISQLDSLLNRSEIDLKKFTQTTKSDEIKNYPQTSKDDLAVIIYTSGTTGNSKGVMLTHDNLIFDAVNTGSIHRVVETDVFISVLPLAHTYECTIGMIIPILNGATIHYIDKAPTATYLAPLFQNIRPTTMLTVPLIIEKIYKNSVRNKLNASPVTRTLLKASFTRKILHRAAGKKLMKFFGGRMRFFGVGGAALTPEVEKFLLEAKFPYAVGYGLTETAPMLSGFGPTEQVYRSVGKAIADIELRINNPDPETGEGEIVAKGRNIMTGYYKNPEQTKKVFTQDGFFRTGDLGIMDKHNIIYIRGRSKNMILGANGENIYPEEIESIINSQEFVNDSLVLQVKGKLVAMIHPNFEHLEQKFQQIKSDAQEKQAEMQHWAEEFITELKDKVNKQLSKNSKIQKTILQNEPFEKTPTKKIKRYRYEN